MKPDVHPSKRPAVRDLRPEDVEQVVHLDTVLTGLRREEYFKLKLDQALSEDGVTISLVAELEEDFVGFCIAQVHYGEFGNLVPTAVVETFGVHPVWTKRGVGFALMARLREKLQDLGITELQTEVAWENQRLLSFLHHAGFKPAPRLVLSLDLEEAQRRESLRE
jgi:GNAT superfamily N-acetyltransferase